LFGAKTKNHPPLFWKARRTFPKFPPVFGVGVTKGGRVWGVKKRVVLCLSFYPPQLVSFGVGFFFFFFLISCPRCCEGVFWGGIWGGGGGVGLMGEPKFKQLAMGAKAAACFFCGLVVLAPPIFFFFFFLFFFTRQGGKVYIFFFFFIFPPPPPPLCYLILFAYFFGGWWFFGLRWAPAVPRGHNLNGFLFYIQKQPYFIFFKKIQKENPPFFCFFLNPYSLFVVYPNKGGVFAGLFFGCVCSNPKS